MFSSPEGALDRGKGWDGHRGISKGCASRPVTDKHDGGCYKAVEMTHQMRAQCACVGAVAVGTCPKPGIGAWHRGSQRRDRKLGLLKAAARCIADPRSPLLI
jgi:hypothetical protein